MIPLRLPLALLATVVLAVPAGAVAQDTNAPPGNSGIDEYLESVPGAGGNKVPPRRGEKRGRAILTPAQRERLERTGRDGRSLADVVEATSPRTAPRGNHARSLPEATGSSPVDKTIEALGGSDDGDGLGVLLPAILVTALLGTLAVVLVRRRSAS